MFHVIVWLVDSGAFEKFEDAFAHFYRQTREKLERGGLSAMELYETNWITLRDADETDHTLIFQDIVNLADSLGLLRNGELVENPGPVDIATVHRRFGMVNTHFKGVLAYARMVNRMAGG
jgi:hypothetical protein